MPDTRSAALCDLLPRQRIFFSIIPLLSFLHHDETRLSPVDLSLRRLTRPRSSIESQEPKATPWPSLARQLALPFSFLAALSIWRSHPLPLESTITLRLEP